MKHLLHSFLSSLLIVSVMFLGVSSEVFHDHEEHDHHCDTAHVEENVDACHMRIFHEGGAVACTDHQHLLDGTEECVLCQLQIPQYQVFKPNGATENVAQLAQNFASGFTIEIPLQNDRNLNPNRGPPLVG